MQNLQRLYVWTAFWNNWPAFWARRCTGPEGVGLGAATTVAITKTTRSIFLRERGDLNLSKNTDQMAIPENVVRVILAAGAGKETFQKFNNHKKSQPSTNTFLLQPSLVLVWFRSWPIARKYSLKALKMRNRRWATLLCCILATVSQCLSYWWISCKQRNYNNKKKIKKNLTAWNKYLVSPWILSSLATNDCLALFWLRGAALRRSSIVCCLCSVCTVCWDCTQPTNINAGKVFVVVAGMQQLIFF